MVKELCIRQPTWYVLGSSDCVAINLGKYASCSGRSCRDCIYNKNDHRVVPSLEETIELVDELVSPAQEPPLAASMRKNLV